MSRSDEFAVDLMQRLANADPCYQDSEWGGSCFYCCASEGAGGAYEHEWSCDWMIARELLQLPPRDGHVLIRTGPPPPPIHGPFYLAGHTRRVQEEIAKALALQPFHAERGAIRIIPPPNISTST